MEKELNFNDGVVETLKNEEKLLRGRMKLELDKGNYQMYKQLINAYSEVVSLIKQYDFQLMYSEYRDGETEQKQVAVWEQNGDIQIRNHKIWDVIEYKVNSAIETAKRILRMEDTYLYQIDKVSDTLKKLNIDVKDSHSEYKSYTNIINELSVVWKSLNNKEDNFIKENILKTMAGIRDKEMLRLLIENYNN